MKEGLAPLFASYSPVGWGGAHSRDKQPMIPGGGVGKGKREKRKRGELLFNTSKKV